MNRNRIKSEETAFNFNKQIAKKINSVIEPLGKIVPITNFSYLRFYEDGRLLHLQPDHCLLEYLLDNKFNAQGLKNENLKIAVQETVKSKHYLWPSNSNDDLSLFLSTFGLKNTMSVITKNNAYIESLTLSNSLDDAAGYNLNKEYKEIYDHFRFFFIDKINSIIDFNDKSIYFQSTLFDYYTEDSGFVHE